MPPKPFKSPKPPFARGGGGWAEPPDISPIIEKKVFRYLEENEPDKAAELHELRHRNPFEYRERMQHVMHELHAMARLEKDRPDVHEQLMKRRKLEAASRQLGKKYRTATSKDDTARIEKELRAVLEELFPLRCLELEMRIQELSRELDRARAVLAKKREAKAQVIERRLHELTGHEDELAW